MIKLVSSDSYHFKSPESDNLTLSNAKLKAQKSNTIPVVEPSELLKAYNASLFKMLLHLNTCSYSSCT